MTARDITSLLAATLGWEKADEVVALAISRMGVDPSRLTAYQARKILELLASAPGIVGVTARFAQSRASFGSAAQRRVEEARAAANAMRPGAAATTGRPRQSEVRVKRSEIAALLGPNVDAARSARAVDDAARELGVQTESLTPQQAIKVLDALANEDGVVGVAARFAKARFALSG